MDTVLSGYVPVSPSRNNCPLQTARVAKEVEVPLSQTVKSNSFRKQIQLQAQNSHALNYSRTAAVQSQLRSIRKSDHSFCISQ
jgi:hypothetical protein